MGERRTLVRLQHALPLERHRVRMALLLRHPAGNLRLRFHHLFAELIVDAADDVRLRRFSNGWARRTEVSGYRWLGGRARRQDEVGEEARGAGERAPGGYFVLTMAACRSG